MKKVFSGPCWENSTHSRVGISRATWNEWWSKQNPSASKKFGRQAKPGDFGAILVKNGYKIEEWGNIEYRYQSASVGKAFTKLVLQLSIDKRLIGSVHDLVSNYWTGLNFLDNPLKQLDYGAHRFISFNYLYCHCAGFPVTNGFFWRNQKNVPKWASCSGDPSRDNYAHCQPGKFTCYSSGGYWRLSQILTKVWGQDLKSVLDEHLFSKIGIEPSSWRWLGGDEVRSNMFFYPEMPGYGDFIDPPYTINGYRIQGGGGWVEMSPVDLARVGLLIARRGLWEKCRLLSDSELLNGHKGGNDSELYVDKARDLVFAKVTTDGLDINNLKY
ncbi:hypothetical protein GCM10007160_37610 [Litchfieldella qijiaojingensis]|uniref:Beta-lactamase-related domain-containing protein n=1 Tax=Litchfieldella qijiaojingensis TaxID=980347 RepID=A0ABQ2Z6D5_9GAMM|nr:serine hydrolase [Halomonas qijiaojingensis]GGY06528.1 hypothetical protein GCM10007160_37610 [Halomonas qijiaojingensis]